jgi:hypothetical protein
MADQEDSRIVTCKCGQQMKVPESALGKTGTCVGCGRKLRLTKQMTEMPSGMASADDRIMKGPMKKLKEISDKELKQRKKLTPKECVIGGIVGCLLIGTCLVIMDEDKPRGTGSTDGGAGPSRSSVSNGLEKRISGDNWFGCTARDYFEKLVGYAVQKDNEAFAKALTTGLLSGTCTRFKNGEVVYIANTALFSGLVKVRRKGETQEYWTNIEAVK